MKSRKVSKWIFAGYCVLMLWLLFGRERYATPEAFWDVFEDRFNPVPFETILRFVKVLRGDFSGEMKRHAIVNLVGNVIMFVPLGYFPAKLWQNFRPLWRCALYGGGIIVCVEVLQLVTLLGTCDFDDLLLNVIGISVGYGIYRLTGNRKIGG